MGQVMLRLVIGMQSWITTCRLGPCGYLFGVSLAQYNDPWWRYFCSAHSAWPAVR